MNILAVDRKDLLQNYYPKNSDHKWASICHPKILLGLYYFEVVHLHFPLKIFILSFLGGFEINYMIWLLNLSSFQDCLQYCKNWTQHFTVTTLIDQMSQLAGMISLHWCGCLSNWTHVKCTTMHHYTTNAPPTKMPAARPTHFSHVNLKGFGMIFELVVHFRHD